MGEPSQPARALRLPELIAIGVGGMIGGGIFSVLGMAAHIAGHAAPLCFVVGSLVALSAGYSYVKLALAYSDDGASYTYLERAFPQHPNIGGIAGWAVIVGYVGTLALYAFTFGAYAAHLLGQAGSTPLRASLSAGVLLFFMAVNLVGAQITGRAEDLIVYTKVILLGLFVAAGLHTASISRLSPLFDRGLAAPFIGGALIFVAFEGFQLITNGVTETQDPRRNIPRGLYGSIVITSVIYIGVAFVALGNLSVAELTAAEEYALAVAARPALGHAGTVLVDIAALLATSSAINATLFGASRMLGQMATEKTVPRAFSHRTRARVPWLAVVVMTGLGLAFTMTSSLETIATFSSLMFLLVSMAVSVANLRLRATTGSHPGLVLLGLVLMGVTVATLLADMLRTNEQLLAIVLSILAAVALLEVTYFKRTHLPERPRE